MKMSENDVRQALMTARGMLQEANEKIASLQQELAQERHENSIQKMARHMNAAHLNAYGNDVDEIVEKLASMNTDELNQLAATIQLSNHPAVFSLGTVGGNGGEKVATQHHDEADPWAGFKTSVASIAGR